MSFLDKLKTLFLDNSTTQTQLHNGLRMHVLGNKSIFSLPAAHTFAGTYPHTLCLNTYPVFLKVTFTY